MVVRLRLQRFGQRNTPFYRLVAADSRFPRDGRFLERVSSIRFKLIHSNFFLTFYLYIY